MFQEFNAAHSSLRLRHTQVLKLQLCADADATPATLKHCNDHFKWLMMSTPPTAPHGVNF